MLKNINSFMRLLFLTAFFSFVYASAQALSIDETYLLDKKNKALEATSVLLPHSGVFSLPDSEGYWKAYLSKENVPYIKEIDILEALTQSSTEETFEENDLGSDFPEFWEHVQKIPLFDKSFVYVLPDTQNDETLIVHSKSDGSSELLASLPGSYFKLVHDDYSSACIVFTQKEPSETVCPKGNALCLINKYSRNIPVYKKVFSLKAKPFVFETNAYFLDEDQSIISIYSSYSEDESDFEISWVNEEKLDIVDMGKTHEHSFIKYRKNGKDIYRFFYDDFDEIINEEEDIYEFEYFNAHYDFSPEQFSSKDIPAALIIKDNGINRLSSIRFLSALTEQREQRDHLNIVDLQLKEKEKNNQLKKSLLQFYKSTPISILELLYEEIIEKGKDMITFEKDNSQLLKKLDDFFDDLTQEKQRSDVEFSSFELPLSNLFEGDLSAKANEMVSPYSLTKPNPEDGLEIPFYVWPAKGASAQAPKPLVVYVHGGPDLHLDKHFYPLFQYLANEGYWVIAPNTRGSTGFGEHHQASLRNNFADMHIKDVIAVTDYFKQHPHIKSNTTFLMGASFGGYTTLATSVHKDFSNYFNAYLSLAGISEVGQAILGNCEYKLLTDATEYRACLGSWENRVGFKAYENTQEIQEKTRLISPLYHVENLNKPVLLIHGVNDTTVFPIQSEQFHTKALNLGKESELLLLENENHFFDRTEVGFKQTYKAMSAFLKKQAQ